MINLLTLLNAADRAAITETNFERVDASLAFGLSPSTDPATNLAVTYVGSPAAGTWSVGQWWVDASLALWRCTAAGTPGTWLQQSPAVVAAAPAGAPVNYLIVIPAQKWAQFCYDGAAWQPVFLQPS